MGAAHENRVKRMYLREAQARNDRQAEREVMRRSPAARRPAPQVKAPLPPSKAQVRRWMRLHAAEYEHATALAEGCSAALDLPETWLDDPAHWVWDLAAEEADHA